MPLGNKLQHHKLDSWLKRTDRRKGMSQAECSIETSPVNSLLSNLARGATCCWGPNLPHEFNDYLTHESTSIHPNSRQLSSPRNRCPVTRTWPARANRPTTAKTWQCLSRSWRARRRRLSSKTTKISKTPKAEAATAFVRLSSTRFDTISFRRPTGSNQTNSSR